MYKFINIDRLFGKKCVIVIRTDVWFCNKGLNLWLNSQLMHFDQSLWLFNLFIFCNYPIIYYKFYILEQYSYRAIGIGKLEWISSTHPWFHVSFSIFVLDIILYILLQVYFLYKIKKITVENMYIHMHEFNFAFSSFNIIIWRVWWDYLLVVL